MELSDKYITSSKNNPKIPVKSLILDFSLSKSPKSQEKNLKKKSKLVSSNIEKKSQLPKISKFNNLKSKKITKSHSLQTQNNISPKNSINSSQNSSNSSPKNYSSQTSSNSSPKNYNPQTSSNSSPKNYIQVISPSNSSPSNSSPSNSSPSNYNFSEENNPIDGKSFLSDRMMMQSKKIKLYNHPHNQSSLSHEISYTLEENPLSVSIFEEKHIKNIDKQNCEILDRKKIQKISSLKIRNNSNNYYNYDNNIYHILNVISSSKFYDYILLNNIEGVYIMNGLIFFNMGYRFIHHCLFNEINRPINDMFRSESSNVYFLIKFINISYLSEDYYMKKLLKKISNEINKNNIKIENNVFKHINNYIKYIPTNIQFLLSTINQICKSMNINSYQPILSILYLRIITPIFVNNLYNGDKKTLKVIKLIQKKINNIVNTGETHDNIDIEIINSLFFIKNIDFIDNNSIMYNELIANKIYIYFEDHLKNFEWLSNQDYNIIILNMNILKKYFPKRNSYIIDQ